MDVFKYVKFEDSPGEYGDSIPIGSSAKYVDLQEGITVQDAIGDIKYFEKGNIGKQLTNFQNELQAFSEDFFEDPYYSEISYSKERKYDTTCYFITIPVYDTNGNIIDLHMRYNTPLKQMEYAQENRTTISINGNSSILMEDGTYKHGITICDGVITNTRSFNNFSYTDITSCCYIGVKSDRSTNQFPMKSNITAQELLNSGYINVFNAYQRLVSNGQIDTSYIGHQHGKNDLTEEYAHTVCAPRTVFGIKQNNEIVILVCDGRNPTDKGLTFIEASQLMIEKGCVTAYNLDGGGSSSLVYKGSRLNKLIDENGTEERDIPYTICFIKPLKQQQKNNISEAFNQIGKEKKEIIQQIIPRITNIESNIENNTTIDYFLFQDGTITDSYTPILTMPVDGTPRSYNTILFLQEYYPVYKIGIFNIICRVNASNFYVRKFQILYSDFDNDLEQKIFIDYNQDEKIGRLIIHLINAYDAINVSCLAVNPTTKNYFLKEKNIQYRTGSSLPSYIPTENITLPTYYKNAARNIEINIVQPSQEEEPFATIYRGQGTISGHSISMNYRITVTKEIPPNTILFEIPEKYAPSTTLDGYLVAAGKTYFLAMNRSGKIYYPNFSNQPNIELGAYNFSFTYNI